MLAEPRKERVEVEAHAGGAPVYMLLLEPHSNQLNGQVTIASVKRGTGMPLKQEYGAPFAITAVEHYVGFVRSDLRCTHPKAEKTSHSLDVMADSFPGTPIPCFLHEAIR